MSFKAIPAREPAGGQIAGQIELLKHDFPSAFREGKIDFEVLRQLLGGAVDEREERYGLNWHGKRAARQLALTPSAGTLRPDPAQSVDWDTTQNLMIEGENLEVLKLLQKPYAGQVKLIYIDPPYNTGKDFIYPDNFRDSIDNYLALTGQRSAAGEKLTTNPESSGRFHTDWLNMMYPRLFLARNLLRDDGAIFVSCDETEQPRLRLLLDELFGQENLMADFVWSAGRKNDSRFVSISHEYICCYCRNSAALARSNWRRRKSGLDEIYAEHKRLVGIHGQDYAAVTVGMKKWFGDLPGSHPSRAHSHYNTADARGLYFPADISWPGGNGPQFEVLHPATGRPVARPKRGWMTSDPATMAAWIADDKIHFGADESAVPCIKAYLSDHESEAPYSVFYRDGRAATKRLRALLGSDAFPFPKDETVIQGIVGFAGDSDGLVLDFFAGSGTTGHAVMAQNAADGGTRRYILVQLPEPTERTDYKTIADICRERLRRAGEKVRAESPMFHGDTGFRAFRLDSSNLQAWDPAPENVGAAVQESIEHLKADRSEEDILYELLLRLNLDLSLTIDQREIAGKAVFSAGAGTLFACLAPGIALAEVEPLALGIAAWRDELAPAAAATVVVRDSAFADDVAKANCAAILIQHGFSEANLKSL